MKLDKQAGLTVFEEVFIVPQRLADYIPLLGRGNDTAEIVADVAIAGFSYNFV